MAWHSGVYQAPSRSACLNAYATALSAGTLGGIALGTGHEVYAAHMWPEAGGSPVYGLVVTWNDAVSSGPPKVATWTQREASTASTKGDALRGLAGSSLGIAVLVLRSHELARAAASGASTYPSIPSL